MKEGPAVMSGIKTRSVKVPPTSMPRMKPFWVTSAVCSMFFSSQRSRFFLINGRSQPVSRDDNSVEIVRGGGRHFAGDDVAQHALRLALERMPETGAGRSFESHDLTFADRVIGKCRRQFLFRRSLRVHRKKTGAAIAATEQTGRCGNLAEAAGNQPPVMCPVHHFPQGARPPRKQPAPPLSGINSYLRMLSGNSCSANSTGKFAAPDTWTRTASMPS